MNYLAVNADIKVAGEYTYFISTDTYSFEKAEEYCALRSARLLTGPLKFENNNTLT